MLTSTDFFCGMGGSSTGLVRAGFRIVTSTGCRMIRLLLVLTLTVAISATVLLFGVLWESDATDYEGVTYE